MKVALISGDESALPSRTVAEIRALGIELVCKKCHSAADVLEAAKDAETVWIFGPNPYLDGDVLAKLPKCRALFRSGSGVDALPVARATELGVAICNTPESIAESVAEHAAALLLALARKISVFDRVVRRGEWPEAESGLLPFHLSGRTLGLVGYGRIARKLEALLAGFKLQVLHFDPASPDSTPLEELLQKSDFVSLHCPLTPKTRNLLDAKRLEQMKTGALLINTSRGAIIDEPALAEALRSGRIAGAALDVTAAEPLPENSPLRGLENIIITPHVAAFDTDFEQNFWDGSVAKLAALQTGDYRKNSVNL